MIRKDLFSHFCGIKMACLACLDKKRVKFEKVTFIKTTSPPLVESTHPKGIITRIKVSQTMGREALNLHPPLPSSFSPGYIILISSVGLRR